MEDLEAKYAEFEEKVKRTVYLDNLSPKVTESILREALGQFVTVKSIQFIPNYLEFKDIPQCALVETEKPAQANVIISTFAQQPLMIGGMPRPVRALNAKMEMFDDRPRKPGGNIQFRWLDPEDPDFEVTKKLKELIKVHAMETEYVLKRRLEDEEKLARQQQEALKAAHEKYKMLDGVIREGSVRKLAGRYNMKVADD